MTALPTCGAMSRQSGLPCKLVAGHGTTHKGVGRCKYHGGASPQAERKGREELLRRDAERTLTKELAGRPIVPIDDPIAALEQTVAEAATWADLCRARVEELAGDWSSFSPGQGEQVRALIGLYERAMDRSQRFLEGWHRLGMDERRTQLAEAQVRVDAAKARATLDAVVATLNHALADPGLGLTDWQRERTRTCIACALEPRSDPPPAPPMAGMSGQLPALRNAVDLLNRLARRDPKHWSPEARQDAEALQRAASAFLAVWGEPVDLVGEAVTPTLTRALEPAVDDAEVVGEEA